MSMDGHSGRDPALDADTLVRSALEDRGRALARIGVSAIVSAFLFAYVGVWVGAGWFAAVAGLEALGLYAGERVVAGDRRFRVLDRGVVLAVSLCWVTHALLLWRVGGEIPRIATIMDLFTVALYGVIGAHKDRRLMLALIVPPLATLSALLIAELWATVDPALAVFATLATLGACGTILMNGLAMHASDAALCRANAALAGHAEAARRATKAKDVFLANMSHEIRTPLSGVIGLAAALVKTDLSARQSEMAGLIHASGETLERLLNDLLDLSKIEAEKFELRIAPFDLREAIETAAQLMRLRADDKGVAFNVTYGPGACGMFQGDAVRIRQIVGNLASNAVKFTAAGSVAVQVDVVEQGEDAPALVRIGVRDTGIGFDAEAGARLFQRFEQADDSISGTFGGTGLGLAICHSLAGMMEGTLQAVSTPGEGSLFTAELRLRRAPASAATATRAPLVPRDEARDAAGGTRILIAEDNEMNQKVLSLMLAPFGATLSIARDGHAALALYAPGRFDLILMDMQMPGMDGLAATRAIRAIEARQGAARTPIAMLSANAGADHVAQADTAGCDLHIAKPVTPQSLIEGVRRALALREGPPPARVIAA